MVLSLLVGDHLEAAFGGALHALEGDVFSTAVLGGFIYLADLGRPEAARVSQEARMTEQEKVAVRQAALTERQLETQVRKPADAERYRVETDAEAKRTAEIKAAEARRAATIAGAEAKAEETRLSGEAEKARRSALAEAEAIEDAKRGEAEKARRVAEAEAVKAEGDAQASATLAVGQAQAEAMDKRAEAFAHYNDAAVLQMLIEVLPQIAKEVAAPIAAIDQLTVLSTDGAGGMPKQVVDNVAQTLQMLKTATGIDVDKLIHKAVDGRTDDAAVVAGATEEPSSK